MGRPATVIDLIPGKPTPTRVRVEQRKALLKRWIKQGVPSGQMPLLPTSLRKAAEWNDSSIGVEPIGSPNQFVTTHDEWGDDVAAIKRMLDELHARSVPVQRKKSTTAANDDLRQNLRDVRALLAAVTSQWQMAQEQLAEAKETVASKEREVVTCSLPAVPI